MILFIIQKIHTIIDKINFECKKIYNIKFSDYYI